MRLQIENEDELMLAMGGGKLTDRKIMEASVPGFGGDAAEIEWPSGCVISIRGCTSALCFVARRTPPPGTGRSNCRVATAGTTGLV